MNEPTPSALKDEIIKLEYASLRDELSSNKKYIFERPLLIIGAIGIALVQSKDTFYIAILPFLLVVAVFSAAFIFNWPLPVPDAGVRVSQAASEVTFHL